MSKENKKDYSFGKILILSIVVPLLIASILGIDSLVIIIAILMALTAVTVMAYFTNTKNSYKVKKLKEIEDRELTEEEKSFIKEDKQKVVTWAIIKIVIFFAAPIIGLKIFNPNTDLGIGIFVLLVPTLFTSLCKKVYEKNVLIGTGLVLAELEVGNFNKPMQYMLTQRYKEYHENRNSIEHNPIEIYRDVDKRIQAIMEQNGYDYYKGWKWGEYVQDKKETYGGLIELLYTERKYVTDNYLKAEDEVMTEEKAIRYLNEMALNCKQSNAILDVVCFLEYINEGRDETGKVFENFIHEELEHPYQNFRNSWRKKQQWKDGLIDKYNYLISTLNEIKEECIEDARDYYAIDSLRYVKAIELSVNLLTQELRAVRRIDIDMTTTPRKVRHNIRN